MAEDWRKKPKKPTKCPMCEGPLMVGSGGRVFCPLDGSMESDEMKEMLEEAT